MKKVLSLMVFCLILVFGVVACDKTTLAPTTAPTAAPTTAPTTAEPEPVAHYIAAPYTLAEGQKIDDQFLDPVFYENVDGPTIGVTLLGVIELGGKYFRDLDNDHELDVFEDWREDAETRAAAMAASLSTTQLAYNLLNNMMYSPKTTKTASAVDENGKPVWSKVFSNTVADLSAQKYRNFVVRNNPETEVAVWFNNGLEQYAEWDAITRGETAVPFLSFTNPINHGMPGTLGISAAALGDGNADLVLTDAQYDGDIMWAKGIDGIYGPQIDLATDPRWSRNSGTYGEVVSMYEQIARNLVLGYQNGDDGMVEGSILLTVKHFPGDGAAYNGFESHGNTGRYRLYQTENSFGNYQLKPFIAAFEAGAAGVMEGYSMPVFDGRSALQSFTYKGVTYDINYDGYGNAFNEDLLQGLLRNILGFKGLINSDSLSSANCHGVNEYGDNLTGLEQTVLFVKAGNGAGVFAAGGFMGSGMTIQPGLIAEAYVKGLITREDLESAAVQRLEPRAKSGDLDNPYRDMEESIATVNALKDQVTALAEETHKKSVVLLKNAGDVLPLVGKTESIYFSGFSSRGQGNIDSLKDAFVAKGYTAAADYANAKVAYLRVSPSLVGQGKSELAVLDLGEGFETPIYSATAQKTEDVATINTVVDMDVFQAIADQVHANGGIVIGEIVINAPWILAAMEPYCDALIGTFSTSDAAITSVITGEYAPTGKLPITMVAHASVINCVTTTISGQTWEICVSPNDVPGYAKEQYMKASVLAASPSGHYCYKDSANNLYWSGFGLTYTK